MKKLFHFKTRDKIFYSYLISYLVIGILPILISLFVYFNYGRVVLDDIHTSQSSTLSQLKNGFDDNLETVVKTGNMLAENDKLKELITIKGFSAGSLLEAAKFKDEMNTIKSSINFCSEIFVYLYSSDSIITNTKLYPSEINYIFANNYQLTKGEMLTAIDTPDYKGYKIIKDKDGNSSILFLQNVYSYNYKDKLATIVTVVPWKNIAAGIATMKEGKIYWINKGNQILGDNKASVSEDAISYNDYSNESKLIEKRIGSTKYVNSYVASDYYDFKYCITIPKSHYMKEMNNLIFGIVLQIMVMIGLAFILAWYYSVKNYKPISRLFTALKKNKKAARDINFDNIENYIENLYLENQTLSNSCNQAKDALFNQVVNGYIKGWNNDESILEETILSNTGVSLKKPYITMAITYADIMECNLFSGISESEKENTFKLLKFVVKNIFEENILSKYAGFFSDIDGMHLCVLNITDEILANGSLSFDIRKCLSIYKKLLNLKVNIGASKIHKECEAFSKAYNEAAQVLSFQSFWGKDYDAFAFYEETNMEYDTVYNYDSQLMEKQKKLYNMIVSKEYEQATEFLNQILDEMFIKDIHCMDINKCRMFALINTVYSCLSDIVGRSDGEYFKKLNPMERMLKANSIESARHIMNDIFREITDHLKKCLTNEYPNWVQEIIDFVDDNYSDPNLNVSILADKLNMNLSYVGRTFKSYTGYGITDMIHIRRIEECKRRLLLGESVREAAESIGYLDSKSLIRIFKKYEGITPGQYKSNFEKQIVELA
ncbi:helix-turn-helix domain-containing protein [Anaerocolumna chitinilytica]|uniref:Putative HTH-type transcriptional regulator YtdP n=1 Tax=Anaerocolumna chitinilytica TaxID=1727145 RepID=A0A7I8DRG7_9FIRM|nr:response regulator transcription factor [Anaerocolumna chitinilytica]BCK00980.1 putative HTH-type transcriptional regulator YtdP [Anaerocolumna chitinilytica]